MEGVSVGLVMALAVMSPAADYNPAGGFCGNYYEDYDKFQSYLEDLRLTVDFHRATLYEWSSEINESGQISLQNVHRAASADTILRSGERMLYQGSQFAKFCDWSKMVSK
jgi:hypothetical protein